MIMAWRSGVDLVDQTVVDLGRGEFRGCSGELLLSLVERSPVSGDALQLVGVAHPAVAFSRS